MAAVCPWNRFDRRDFARTRLSALQLLGFSWALAATGLAQAASAEPIPASLACVDDAARFHNVNSNVLKAILKVESSFNSNAINRNANGTVDVGIGQINTIHFKELAKHSIAPQDLLDPCIGTYVAAWHLGNQLKSYGNSWFGIAAYHSVTPYFNYRYQTLVFNALVDMKVQAGPKMPVPALPLLSRSTPVRPGASVTDKNPPHSIFALNE
jgi:soluble lytic murein transglycosylase-like protein